VTNHLGEIESDRAMATAILFSQTTPDLTKGGQGVSVQGDLGQDWLVPFVAGSAFGWATSEKEEVDLTLKRGHYTPLGVQNQLDLDEPKKQVYPTTAAQSAGISSGRFTLVYQLAKMEWCIQTLQAPAGANNMQSGIWTVDASGEFVGTTQWNGQFPTSYTQEQFKIAFKIMQSMPFSYDNPNHGEDLVKAMVNGLGSLGVISQEHATSVKEWIPRILSALSSAYSIGSSFVSDLAPMLLPLI
jgi:hypothetical protein